MDEVISSKDYDFLIDSLRGFFKSKNFIEVPSQTRASILAACEDPKTVSTFQIGGDIWPLPQTGQMCLEIELLKNPEFSGVFCITTSYRNEPIPIPGRHNLIFPLFEFESWGNIDLLKKLEKELLSFLGFKNSLSVDYEKVCKENKVEILESKDEENLWKSRGEVVFIEKFPERTSPFWNMKHAGGGIFKKVDVILCGMETIGSAERSCNVEEMRKSFFTISDGGYSNLLFDLFGKERVTKELEEYLSFKMVPRFGGGIGMTRLLRAMKLSGILD